MDIETVELKQFRSLTTDHMFEHDMNLYSRDTNVTWWGRFDTCGDGEIKHSPTYGVPSDPSVLMDFFGGAAIALAEHNKEGTPVEHSLPTPYLSTGHNHALGMLKDSPDVVKFVHKFVYNEDKTRYFCAKDMAVSTAYSKMKLKGWEAIPRWADGTAASWTSVLSAGGGTLGDYYLAGYLVSELISHEEAGNHACCYSWLCAIGDKESYANTGRMAALFEAVDEYVRAFRRNRDLLMARRHSNTEAIRHRIVSLLAEPQEAAA